ncbi:MAG TPA: protein-L-isoaspartate(D-aspartate) O-methyltransferase [Gammaproteobacteria bacterium]|nr:protein-L-isoaspartate(D-aspartate) O-methyltransferase [Gammaproteobacteria bacterium]
MLFGSGSACSQPSYDSQRAALIAEIERDIRRTQSYTGRARFDPNVLDAIGKVPRHEFVPDAYRDFAYENRPLPIGNGQTISQPYIVALMTELASVDADSVVLEIGTGSGYQAAVLAEIARHVYSIEIVASLGERAAETLERLGYTNVSVRIGDGYQGWPEYAPFDAIIVTAAPEQVPAPLIGQLKPGGRLVVPVGPEGGTQSLRVIEKDAAGELSSTDVLPVRFVPFTRDE